MSGKSQHKIAKENIIKITWGDPCFSHSFLRRQVKGDYPFEMLPDDIDTLHLIGMPWSTCSSTGIRFHFSYDAANQWGKKITGYSGLYFYAESPSGAQFHVKMVLHVEEVKEQGIRSEAGKSYQRLLADAMFYMMSVRGSQAEGVLFPKHYGLWDGKTEEGGHIAISIYEWAGLPWSMIANGHVAYEQHDTTENRRVHLPWLFPYIAYTFCVDSLLVARLSLCMTLGSSMVSLVEASPTIGTFC